MPDSIDGRFFLAWNCISYGFVVPVSRGYYRVFSDIDVVSRLVDKYGIDDASPAVEIRVVLILKLSGQSQPFKPFVVSYQGDGVAQGILKRQVILPIDQMVRDNVMCSFCHKAQLDSAEIWYISGHKPYKCIGCAGCANVCPARAIEVTDFDEGWRRIEFKLMRCISCGRCEEVCPEQAVKLTDEFELSTAAKEDLTVTAEIYMDTCQRCGRCFKPKHPLDKMMVTGFRE